MSEWVQNVPLQIDTTHFLKIKRKNVKMEKSKDGNTLISSLHVKFKSVNCLSIDRTIKHLSKVIVRSS